jgi:hypothetical protein
MMTATPRKSRKPQTRSAKVQPIGTSTILWLTVDHNVTAYRVLPLPHAFGNAAFRLEKADKGQGEPERYDVLLDGSHSTCECQGFLRHGMRACGGTGCKHIAGCQAALNAGQLPTLSTAQTQPAPSAPEPAEEVIELTEAPPQPADEQDNFCRHCGCRQSEHISGFCPA